MNTFKVGIGLALLVVSSFVLFAAGTAGSRGAGLALVVTAAVATLGLAAGTWLVGTATSAARKV